MAAYGVCASTARAEHSCSKASQSKIDDVIKEQAEQPNVTTTDEGDLVRMVFMEEDAEEHTLNRTVTLYTKPNHPNHPMVVLRKMGEGRKFYMTTNRGWAVSATAECAAMLAKLVTDEGSTDKDEVSLEKRR